MYFSLTSSFWYSVTELDIYPQTWKSIFDKQVLSFKFISYLYGMKANTKPLCDLYYKNSFHKRKQNMKKWEKWHESKQMLHKKYGQLLNVAHLIGSSLSQVISYHLRTEKALELKSQRLETYQLTGNSLIGKIKC